MSAMSFRCPQEDQVPLTAEPWAVLRHRLRALRDVRRRLTPLLPRLECGRCAHPGQQQLLLMLEKEEDEDPLMLVISADVRKPRFRVFKRVSAKRWCCEPFL
ncbi:hypothetical protein HPB47_010088 [Ixodes persulcatus]|uniref:Uncharacterized protein n=1 Tax=Ixodes persulcatus TaxID=34615 RepID=A0AC60P0S4_IXOPE|nr:hypothetical protein HPB47_010088 [Ixodes persulcatus]